MLHYNKYKNLYLQHYNLLLLDMYPVHHSLWLMTQACEWHGELHFQFQQYGIGFQRILLVQCGHVLQMQKQACEISCL